MCTLFRIIAARMVMPGFANAPAFGIETAPTSREADDGRFRLACPAYSAWSSKPHSFSGDRGKTYEQVRLSFNPLAGGDRLRNSVSHPIGARRRLRSAHV